MGPQMLVWCGVPMAGTQGLASAGQEPGSAPTLNHPSFCPSILLGITGDSDTSPRVCPGCPHTAKGALERPGSGTLAGFHCWVR